jgi:CDGSH-type Zn-finger protein
VCDVADSKLRRTIMADVTIKPLTNGPYEVSGGAKLVDNSGKDYAASGSDPFYLCRCGASKDKPFCDGSHKEIGFKAEETAK